MKYDLRLFAQDVTGYCNNLPKEIKAIYNVYLFDASSATYCCSLIPAADCRFVHCDFIPNDSFDDCSAERRQEIYDYIFECENDDSYDTYVKHSVALKDSQPYDEIDTGDDEDITEEVLEDAIEHLRCNGEAFDFSKLN